MSTTQALSRACIRSRQRRRVMGVFILALFFPISASANPCPQVGEASAGQTLDRSTKIRIIDWIGSKLNEIYVFPDVAARCEASLRGKLAAGEYETVSDAYDFTRRLTADLQEVSHDRHMSVRFAPEPSLGEEPTDEAERKRLLDLRILNWRLDNFLFKKVEHLEGNVGYLRLDEFVDARYAGDTAVAAMNFLGNCDALIVDLRYNGGGNGTMVKLLQGYLFEDETNVCDLENRSEGRTIQTWTPAYVPGPRLDGAHVFVLTSERTFSAAEEFAYDLQSLGRATIVGETTGGGGHTISRQRNEELKIEFQVPNARAVNPVTGTNWEGTGVVPDVSCPAAQANDKAYALALARLYELADPDAGNVKAWLKGLLDYQEGIANPQPITAAEMSAYEGSYGPFRVIVEGGCLFVIDPAGVKDCLFFLGQDTFLIEGNRNMKIVFERNAAGEVEAVFPLAFDGSRGSRISRDRRSGG